MTEAGQDTVDVRTIGLRGNPDEDVFERAASEERIIVTRDRGFASVLRFHVDRHPGIVLVRLPTTLPVPELVRRVLVAVLSLDEDAFRFHVVVVEPGRIRTRRLR